MRINESPTHISENKPGQQKQTGFRKFILCNWKILTAQSLLISMSVIMGLLVVQYINFVQHQNQSRVLLKHIRAELLRNKQAEQQQYAYLLSVVHNIDSALAHPTFQKQIVAHDTFDISLIAPNSLMYRYFDQSAWNAALSQHILSDIDFRRGGLLSRIYQEQNRIMTTEDRVNKVILNPEARKPQNIQTTLMLLKDTYRTYAVARAPTLLKLYDDALQDLSAFQ